MTSSHIVLTEPVPDVIAELGWTGGECMTDGRTLVHYFRTTRDGRILLGWGGGRLAYGSRVNGRVEVDPEVARAAHAALVRLFPGLEGRRITHAWGGPIDVSPSHLPQVGTLPGAPVHYAFGYTGNGVGPSNLVGRTLAALATGQPDDLTRLPLVGADAGAWVHRSRSRGSAARSCAARWCAESGSRRTGAGPTRSHAPCARPRARSACTWRGNLASP